MKSVYFFVQIYQVVVPLNFPVQVGNFLTVRPCVCVFTLQTGLIVACYQGYVDVVMALSQCPHLDVNWSDNEGNTALITASQAGKNTQSSPIQSKPAHIYIQITVIKCHSVSAFKVNG